MYMSIKDLPWIRPGRAGWKKPFDYTLKIPLVVEQWAVPVGTTIRCVQTQNCGVVILPPGCKDTEGRTIPKKRFTY